MQFSKTMMVSLLISAGLLSSSAYALTPTPTGKPANVVNYPAWDSASTYTAGQRVMHNGGVYEAQWWTKGDNPSTSGTWGAWKIAAPISVTPTTSITPTVTPSITPTVTPTVTSTVTPTSNITLPPSGDAWNSSTVYTAGKRVIYNGRQYEAKWYTVGENPSTSGQWGVWKDLGTIVITSTPTPTPSSTAIVTISPTPHVTPTVTPTPTSIVDTPTVGFVQTTKWRDGASAAYTMFHDDYCSYGTEGQVRDAVPALKQRGLVASFGIITGNCTTSGWSNAKQMIADGHEIYSHTKTHVDAKTATWDAVSQIDGSSNDMAANLDGYRPSFFAWPSDVAADAPLAYLRTAAGYIGGRAPNRVDGAGNIVYDGHVAGVNNYVSDDFQVQWDLYTDQGQWSMYEAQVKAGGDLLNLHVDAAINADGWATRTMHGVNDASWMSVPLAKYQAHLDYLKAKVDAGLLWVSGPSNVIKYRYARDFCKPILSSSGQSIVTFDTSAAQCKKYATPVTLQAFALNAAVPLTASQDGKALSLKPAANNSFLVTVNPLAGPVIFSTK